MEVPSIHSSIYLSIHNYKLIVCRSSLFLGFQKGQPYAMRSLTDEETIQEVNYNHITFLIVLYSSLLYFLDCTLLRVLKRLLTPPLQSSHMTLSV